MAGHKKDRRSRATKAIIHHIGFAKLMLRGSNSLQRPVMAKFEISKGVKG
jgi:hypothetical protein